MERATLKKGVLTKRAIGRSAFTNNNSYKGRLFVLTDNDLNYYEGDEEKQGKAKGNIPLSKIGAVEKVDNNTFEPEHQRFGFQIIYGDYTLYVFAKNDKQRDDWIKCLREAVTGKGSLLPDYHPGAYLSSAWTCCHEKLKTARGCKSTFISSNPPVNKPFPAAEDESVKRDRSETTQTKESPFMVTSKYDFNPVQDTDLRLFRDQQYTILNSKADLNWWFARDNLGREGYIPSNYVAKHEGIECEKWYHADMNRGDADTALHLQKDGTFLVHESSKAAMYTLSFCFQGKVKHYHIKFNQEGKYYISHRHPFDTISELIEYHKLNSAGLVTRLRFPYTTSGEPPVTLGHGVFEISTDELLIKSKIGHGQFGTVHEALWKGKEKVAVKMMKEGTMDQHDFIEEAKLMQRFKHKNLVSIYGISHSLEGSLCIVVELMQNGSLLNYLRSKNERILRHDSLVDIVAQVCAAMMYLEGEKFIHRDLAARNCLVGHNNVIKVADFGLARYVLDDEYTASEGSKFPIRWAAPEVIDFTRFSSKSDVWAFGILCWEVFSYGTIPYPNVKDNNEIVENLRRGYRLPKPTLCSDGLYQLMKTCWEQSPESRPTFKELVEILSSFIDDYEFT